MARLSASRTAGLGEEDPARARTGPDWGDAHLAVLGEIRDELRESATDEV
jgi:hypothetical protein